MKKKFNFLILTLILFIFLPSNFINANSLENNTEPKYIIYIDVNSFTLNLIDKQTKKIVKTYPVAVGKPKTPSPIGTWQITSKALMKDAYGGYWMGLNAPWILLEFMEQIDLILLVLWLLVDVLECIITTLKNYLI